MLAVGDEEDYSAPIGAKATVANAPYGNVALRRLCPTSYRRRGNTRVGANSTLPGRREPVCQFWGIFVYDNTMWFTYPTSSVTTLSAYNAVGVY